MDLNVKCKAIKLLEDNIEENLDDLYHGHCFLDKTTPKVWSMKTVIDKLDFIKIKNSALQQTMPREWENKPQTGRNTSDKGLIQNIQRTLKIQQ